MAPILKVISGSKVATGGPSTTSEFQTVGRRKGTKKEGTMNILSAESPSLQQSLRKSHMYPLCCSVTESCSALCNPMDRSTPGFPVLHSLPELLKLMSTESVMPSNHLILCHPLLLLSTVFPSVRVFSKKSTVHIRWPKYWSFSLASVLQ